MLLGLVFYDLEPVYHFCNELLDNDFLDPQSIYFHPLLLFRYVVTFIAVHEGCRLFPIILIQAVNVLRICDYVLDEFQAQTSMSACIRNMRLYTQLELIMRGGETVTQLVVAILMGAGLVLSVGFNYATLMMYDTLPPMVYPYFPSVSCFIPLIIHCLVPFAIKIHTKGEELVKKQWANRSISFRSERSRRYLKSKVRSIRTIRFYFGISEYRLFPMEKPVKMKFYEAILDCTTNALLS